MSETEGQTTEFVGLDIFFDLTKVEEDGDVLADKGDEYFFTPPTPVDERTQPRRVTFSPDELRLSEDFMAGSSTETCTAVRTSETQL